MIDDDDWISLDEGFPRHASSVLVKTVHGVMEGKYVGSPGDPKAGFVVPAELKYDDITHWRYA